jgi:hypothetical protein
VTPEEIVADMTGWHPNAADSRKFVAAIHTYCDRCRAEERERWRTRVAEHAMWYDENHARTTGDRLRDILTEEEDEQDAIRNAGEAGGAK